ncbi:hypothetical protein BDF22DRAFT_675373 [Syncephalis plumigaleata]|nr:hypothetical protein BDF22DRAFT_675373 [Syncephalis plumigaleata]
MSSITSIRVDKSQKKFAPTIAPRGPRRPRRSSTSVQTPAKAESTPSQNGDSNAVDETVSLNNDEHANLSSLPTSHTSQQQQSSINNENTSREVTPTMTTFSFGIPSSSQPPIVNSNSYSHNDSIHCPPSPPATQASLVEVPNSPRRRGITIIDSNQTAATSVHNITANSNVNREDTRKGIAIGNPGEPSKAATTITTIAAATTTSQSSQQDSVPPGKIMPQRGQKRIAGMDDPVIRELLLATNDMTQVARWIADGLIAPSKAANEVLNSETIDLTRMPMHFFCKDMARGKMSEAGLEQMRLRDERKRQRKLNGTSTTSDDTSDTKKTKIELDKSTTAASSPRGNHNVKMESNSADKPSHSMSSMENHSGPQMKLVDGKMVLDMESLVVQHADLHGGLTEPLERVEESNYTRYVNSSTYGKKNRTVKWSDQQTQLFYDGLAKYGTDFEMIAMLFPDRNRAHIKNKYKREDAENPERVNDALIHRRSKPLPCNPLDFDVSSLLGGTTVNTDHSNSSVKSKQKSYVVLKTPEAEAEEGAVIEAEVVEAAVVEVIEKETTIEEACPTTTNDTDDE